MKRLIATVLLTSLNISAFADWVQIQDTAYFTTFADPKTFEASPYSVKIWELKNFKAPQRTSSGQVFLSRRQLIEYDCNTVRVRYWSILTSTQPTGKGAAVESANFPGGSEWFPMPPGSDGEVLRKEFCDLRR
jgi:hypothetical protein